MTATQAMQAAGEMVRHDDFEHASQILSQMPDTGNLALEIERRFLLAQIAQKKGDINTAIKDISKFIRRKSGPGACAL